MDMGPRPYLSGEGGQGLLHVSFYGRSPFCTSTIPTWALPPALCLTCVTNGNTAAILTSLRVFHWEWGS